MRITWGTGLGRAVVAIGLIGCGGGSKQPSSTPTATKTATPSPTPDREQDTVPAETVHSVKNVGGTHAAGLATYVVEKRKPFSFLPE